MNFKTEQEEFWAGEFGLNYIERNKSERLLASNIALFSRIFRHTNSIQSVIEFGANIGMNLKAIKRLSPYLGLSAIEINQEAVKVLKEDKDICVYPQSILDFNVDYQRDFVLIKGVLIHINPDALKIVYDLLYRSSSKYICIAEYYNPTPVVVDYRGHKNKLFKRDFAGEMLDLFSDLKLIDYGFVYRRDPMFPQDDTNWFLLEKDS